MSDVVHMARFSINLYQSQKMFFLLNIEQYLHLRHEIYVLEVI